MNSLMKKKTTHSMQTKKISGSIPDQKLLQALLLSDVVVVCALFNPKYQTISVLIYEQY